MFKIIDAKIKNLAQPYRLNINSADAVEQHYMLGYTTGIFSLFTIFLGIAAVFASCVGHYYWGIFGGVLMIASRFVFKFLDGLLAFDPSKATL